MSVVIAEGDSSSLYRRVPEMWRLAKQTGRCHQLCWRCRRRLQNEKFLQQLGLADSPLWCPAVKHHPCSVFCDCSASLSPPPTFAEMAESENITLTTSPEIGEAISYYNSTLREPQYKRSRNKDTWYGLMKSEFHRKITTVIPRYGGFYVNCSPGIGQAR